MSDEGKVYEREMARLQSELTADLARAEAAERDNGFLAEGRAQAFRDRDAARAALGRCVEALKMYVAAGDKFIGKVRNGRARSVETYNDLLECHSMATAALTPSALAVGEEWARMRKVVEASEKFLAASIGIWGDEGVDPAVGARIHAAWDELARVLRPTAEGRR